MNPQEMKTLLAQSFGDTLELVEQGVQPYFLVPADQLRSLCDHLMKSPDFYIDYLANITGIDNGPDQGTMEVIYHMDSLGLGHSIVLKVVLENREAPSVPSLTSLWRTANWHERECYDLFGIHFEGHPDLRRILLPANWEGHPMRKDYQEQEYYHGIKVKY